MKRIVIVLLTGICLLMYMISCIGQNNQYLKTFKTVWKKVNKSYYDPAFGGLDWKNIHDQYLPKIKSVENDQDFYRLVNRMLWELNVSHANLIPPGNLARSEPLVCAEGSPGLDIRLLDGEAVITSVRPGSPAWEAGLRSGYVIQAVDEIPVEQIIQEAELLMRPPNNCRGCTGLFTKAVLSRIYGAAGTQVSIKYSEDRGEETDTSLIRIKRNGRALGPKGMLYLAVDFESRLLENGIGYIKLNTFQQPLAPQISNAIKSMGDVAGIIFDLRGNAGGEIEEMPDLFLNDTSLLFLRKSRSGETKMFFNPAMDAYNGPLVLLIDQLCGSACELFAACLQASGRAVVVGEQSPGSVMESDMKVFLNGSILMYPVAQPVTPDGTVLEGHGVVPDIEVGLDREMLLKGVDSQIDAAIKYLNRMNTI
ncbi:MAG: S41 family peptidase [Bacteroidota bacterium]